MVSTRVSNGKRILTSTSSALQSYDSNSSSTKNTTIHIALVLMLLGSLATHIVDEKFACLKGYGKALFFNLCSVAEENIVWLKESSNAILEITAWNYDEVWNKLDPCMHYSRWKNGDMTIILSTWLCGKWGENQDWKFHLYWWCWAIEQILGMQSQIQWISKTSKLMQHHNLMIPGWMWCWENQVCNTNRGRNSSLEGQGQWRLFWRRRWNKVLLWSWKNDGYDDGLGLIFITLWEIVHDIWRTKQC